MRLRDKVAIVTGGARGIGAACAKRFAAEGASVVIADIDEAGGQAQAEAIAAAGGRARFQACDVGDKQQVEALIGATVEAFGGLHILLNNAAILDATDFLEITEADWNRVLRVNLTGYFLCGQAAARQMVAGNEGNGEGGAIVNMSSVNAVVAIPNIASYVACKGGVNQLTRVMALALAEHRIRVNAVGPGSIMTDMVKQVMTDDAARAKILSRTPMGRLGEPEEIAAVALFLASDEASYVTGQCIYADGGRLALNYTVPVSE